MMAVDTNVIVRIVTNDDPEQVKRAIAVFQQDSIFIAKTVLLEVEWVLRFSYRLPRHSIALALRKLLGLSNVNVENPDAVHLALDWYERSLDFADALHLASCGKAERFATFDRKFADEADKLGAMTMVAL